MSKKNRNNKIASKNDDRFDWITPGIPELQEEIELHLIPKKEDKVAITRCEYDALIESRYAIKLIKRMVNGLSSYQFEEAFNVLFGEAKEDEHEPKSE